MPSSFSPLGHQYNLRPSMLWVSAPEQRLQAHPFAAAQYPRRFLFGEDEPIENQLNLGACTANEMEEIMWWVQRQTGMSPIRISRLWQYYQERAREGTVQTDAGATIADTVWVAQNLGVIPEDQWPYNVGQFNQPPPPSLATVASQHKWIESAMLQGDIATCKQWMWNGDGTKPMPIEYGFAVYPQFEQVGPDGLIAMPQGNTLGGHANSTWGWDDDLPTPWGPGAWRIHNCWDVTWGDRGRGWLPYNYPRWDIWGVRPKAQPTPPPPQPAPTPPVKPRSIVSVSLSGQVTFDDQAMQSISLRM